MNANTFVKMIQCYTPPFEQLVGLGLSSKAAERILSGYSCPPRAGGTAHSNELVDLLCRYDTSSLVIGYVELGGAYDFPALSRIRRHRIIVGTLETDIISLDELTGQVVLLDHEDHDRDICIMAASAGHFLDGLACLLRYISETEQTGGWLTDQRPARKCASECAVSAGLPPDADNIWRELCGCVNNDA